MNSVQYIKSLIGVLISTWMFTLDQACGFFILFCFGIDALYNIAAVIKENNNQSINYEGINNLPLYGTRPPRNK